MGVAILIANKIDFQVKSVKRDKEGHFKLVTEKNPSRGNLNTEHLRPKTLLKLKSYIKPHTLIVRHLIPLSPQDRSIRQKVNREIRENVMIQTEKNIPSSQHLIEPSQKLTTYLVTKQTSINTKKRNNPMYFIRSPWFKTVGFLEHMEIKQFSPASSMGQGRNKGRN